MFVSCKSVCAERCMHEVESGLTGSRTPQTVMDAHLGTCKQASVTAE